MSKIIRGADFTVNTNDVDRFIVKSTGTTDFLTHGIANFTMQDSADNTKEVSFDLTGISTGTTRAVVFPNVNGTVVFNDNTVVLTSKTFNLANNTLTGTLAEFNTALSDETFVTLGGSEVLTGKTFTLPQINDTSLDHQYVFGVNELTADRTVTLPLLTTNDIFTFNDHAATLTNKTFDLTDNTLTGTLAEFNTALSDETFATLGGSEVLTGKIFTLPQINDTSSDHQYVFAVNELTADRTVTLPLLGANDIFTFNDNVATLTNKIYDYKSKTLVDTSGSTGGDQVIFVDTSTSILTVTLSTSDAVAGRTILVKDVGGNSTTLNVTIDTEGAELINGSATTILDVDGSEVFLISDGTNWFITDSNALDGLGTAVDNEVYVATGSGAADWKQITSANLVMVHSASDFPTPAGGIITLAPITTYQIAGSVSIGSDRIVMGAGTLLKGLNPFADNITSTTTGALITAGDTSNMELLSFNCDSGSWLDLNGTGTQIFVASQCVVNSCDTIGTITDMDAVILDTCQVTFATSGGITLDGSNHGSFKVTDGRYIANIGPIIDFGTAIFDRIFVINVSFDNPSTVVSSTLATAGSSYDVADTVTLTGGEGTQAVLAVTSVLPVDAQDETNYDGTGTNGTFVGGDGAGALFYVAADVLTMSDGSTVTVDTIDGNDDVLTFTVDSSTSTGALASNVTLTQASNAGSGDDTNFTITLGDANQGIWAVTVSSAGAYRIVPTNPVSQGSTSGSGTGATFTLTTIGQVGLDIAPNSANLSALGIGYITDNWHLTPSSASVGYSNGDIGWIVRGNLGIEDNIDHAQGSIESSALDTSFTGTGPGNEVLANFGTAFVPDIDKGFSTSNTGRFTFLNKIPSTFLVNISAFSRITGGAARTYHFHVAKNGVIINSSVAAREFDGSNPGNVSISCVVDLTSGDFIELFVEAQTALTDLNLDTVSISVTQLGV